MSRLTGPLLSIGASGQIAHSQVYSTWHGIKYARQYVIPSNPNTTGQQLTRNVFKSLDAQYKYLQTLARAPWSAAVKGRAMVPRNMLMKANIPVLRNKTDMADFVASPGNGGGLALSSFAAAASAVAGEIDITLVPPAVPVEWTLVSATVMAFPSRDPATMPTVQDQEHSITVAPWTYTFTGLTSSQAYACSGFLVWTRADGTTVYGPSDTALATPL